MSFILLITQSAQANPYQNWIQFLEDQIQLLEFQQDQLIRRRDAEQSLHGSLLSDAELPTQWLTLQRQILTLQADIETEKLSAQHAIQQENERQQRIQEQQTNRQQQIQARQTQNQQTIDMPLSSVWAG